MKKIYYFSVVLFFLLSCRKDPFGKAVINNENNKKVEIKINSPLLNKTYHIGDTLYLQGSLKSEITIHGFILSVTNKIDNDTLYFSESYKHSKSIEFAESWIIPSTTEKTLKFNVLVHTSDEGTTEQQSVSFTVE